MHLSMFLAPRVFGFAQEEAVNQAGVQQALEADEAGFAAIYVGEQHNNDYEPYADAFTMGGYLAAQLKHAYIGTSVIPLVLHHPLMLIERINLLDQLTRGRVMIGMSSGQPNNGTAFGIHELGNERRQQLFEQKLAVLEAAWAHRVEDGPLEFATDVEQGVMTGRVMPYSHRAPHPLFAIGTNTPAKVEQAGRDGNFVHLGPAPLVQSESLTNLYLDGIAAGGHDAERLMQWFFTTKWVIVGETDEEAYENAQSTIGMGLNFIPWVTKEGYEDLPISELLKVDPGPFAPTVGAPESAAAWVQRILLCGSPETVAAEIEKYRALGMRHLHTRFIMSGMSIDAGQRSWGLFRDEVVPRVNAERIPPPSEDEVRPEFR